MSAHMDWPPAPAISTVFAMILIGSGVIGSIVFAEKKGPKIAKFATIAGALVLIGLGLRAFLSSDLAWSFKAKDEHHAGSKDASAKDTDKDHTHGKPEHPTGDTKGDLLAALQDEHDNVRAKAATELGKLKDPSVVPNLVQSLKDPSTAVKEKAAEALGNLGRPEAREGLEAALGVKNEDEWVNLQEARALARCGGPKGVTALIRMAQEGDAKVVRTQAFVSALALTGRAPVKDPDGAEGKAALQSLAAWWKGVQGTAQWDAAAGLFVAPP